ncbi:F-box/FBD/LRR-repeat protein At5g53840-like [Mercurialis annua]|uniref:F-box/FBD/LRR-repeat protein At5g53840-like n=1 Tax=Mercurialis annua TaxID=3986 RepID=UPI002160DBAE|nr:F-box/FBD/LRR-repeat protein At5g53840-like [Mercurialis annua]
MEKKRPIITPADDISRLPDDILALILSQLSIKEAALTSTLSKRWEPIWKLISILNFDEHSNNGVRHDFISKLLDMHCGHIYSFRLQYHHYYRFNHYIDKWLEIVFRKRIQVIELDFHTMVPQVYSFPRYSDYKCLTVLRLRHLKVTTDDVDHIIAASPLLEVLSIRNASELLSFRIAGPSIKLKALELYYCFYLQSVEISDCSHLVSFKYQGPRVIKCLNNVPLLSRLDLEAYRGSLCYALSAFIIFFPRLKDLTLREAQKSVEILETSPYIPFVLTNLRRLVLEVGVLRDLCLLKYTSLIKKSPFLREFVLRLFYEHEPVDRKCTKAANSPHEHLKRVEIVGYCGCAIEHELARYLVENAVKLEKIIISPCSERKVEATIKAKKLEKRLSQGAELVIH